jgi:hypothetical protein
MRMGPVASSGRRRPVSGFVSLSGPMLPIRSIKVKKNVDKIFRYNK